MHSCLQIPWKWSKVVNQHQFPTNSQNMSKTPISSLIINMTWVSTLMHDMALHCIASLTTTTFRRLTVLWCLRLWCYVFWCLRLWCHSIWCLGLWHPFFWWLASTVSSPDDLGSDLFHADALDCDTIQSDDLEWYATPSNTLDYDAFSSRASNPHLLSLNRLCNSSPFKLTL